MAEFGPLEGPEKCSTVPFDILNPICCNTTDPTADPTTDPTSNPASSPIADVTTTASPTEGPLSNSCGMYVACIAMLVMDFTYLSF